MKTKILFFAFIFPTLTYSQYSHRFVPEFFFGKQPAAAIEAMGKACVSVDGDLGNISFSPAGLASIEKAEIYGSYTPQGFYALGGYYNYLAIGTKVNTYLQIALSHFRFVSGDVMFNGDGFYREKYTFTISSQPLKNLLLGVNANYFRWTEGFGKSASPFYFDFGSIKKIPLNGENSHEFINIGVSVNNFTGATTENNSGGYITKFYLPIIAKFGTSFKGCYGEKSFIGTGNTIEILLQSDYQKLMNSKYRNGIRLGGQVTVLDLLNLRAGFYNDNLDIYNLPEANKSHIEAFTYGLGLQLSLNSISNIPLIIFLNYTNLPQVNPSYMPLAYPHFSTFSIRLAYKKNKDDPQ